MLSGSSRNLLRAISIGRRHAGDCPSTKGCRLCECYKERFFVPGELSDWAERVGGLDDCAIVCKRTLNRDSLSSEMGDMIKLLPSSVEIERKHSAGHRGCTPYETSGVS